MQRGVRGLGQRGMGGSCRADDAIDAERKSRRWITYARAGVGLDIRGSATQIRAIGEFTLTPLI